MTPADIIIGLAAVGALTILAIIGWLMPDDINDVDNDIPDPLKVLPPDRNEVTYMRIQDGDCYIANIGSEDHSQTKEASSEV